MTRLFGFNQGTGTATKNLNWNTGTNKPTYRVNKDWRAKPLPRLETKNNSVESRTATFLKLYWHNYDQWKRNSMNIKTEVLVCIAWADSHLGYALKWENNVGNIWNNDRWNVVHFSSLDSWIKAMAKWLNNTWLWRYNKIWELSQWWRTELWLKWCAEKWEFCYATSPDNWNNNVLNCLSLIHNKQIDENFIYKTN